MLTPQSSTEDPVYDAIDKEFLRSIGITPLDPKGFLEVDSKTLVFSVSPNVPVKQIITDVQWPGALLWDTVKPEREEKAQWTKEIMFGESMWVA
jgi:hypothetical protein